MYKGRHEFRNLQWGLDRKSSILAIKDIMYISTIEARDEFEKLDKFVFEGVYVIEKDSTWDEYNYSVFLEKLKKANVIDFEWIDFVDRELKEQEKQIKERVDKARQWVTTLPEYQQEMIQLLIDRGRVTIIS